ncbi:MAG TPA: glutathione S-transferase N-terminal domain-containing protein, partial [Stellaceae bacterium]|nr:glutathione S-transferase N-terminal domain-containing protein [Stellaceae bacterium]
MAAFDDSDTRQRRLVGRAEHTAPSLNPASTGEDPMTASDLKLYHSAASPNSRRVRLFIAEKRLTVPLVPVDLAKGEQHSDAYRAINPRRLVPTLVLQDGTAIGEVLAIWRYLEEAYRRRLYWDRRRKTRRWWPCGNGA